MNPLVDPSAPRISVVMAAYNTDRYVAEAVDSILSQHCADFEFIIIDDGSTDGTAALLDRYAAQDRRIALVRQPANQGYTRALNLGLSRATGHYVARQDADDVSLPERLGRQADFLDQQPAVGLVASRVEVIDPDGSRLPLDPFAGGLDNEALQRELVDHNPFCHGSVMFRRAYLDQTGGYNEAVELTEDYDLWLRLAEVTAVAKLPETLYRYRHHPASVSHTRRGQQMAAQGQTLEQAMRRRHGARVTGQALRSAAEAFRMAASLYIEHGDRTTAAIHLQRALRLSPELFADPETFVPLPAAGGERDLGFLEQTLADLPAAEPYGRLKRQLRGREHLRRAYAATRTGNWPVVRKHLWLGVSADPSWLANRGTWALAGRAVLGGWPRTPPDAPQGEPK